MLLRPLRIKKYAHLNAAGAAAAAARHEQPSAAKHAQLGRTQPTGAVPQWHDVRRGLQGTVG